jgi:hypothetical protein
MITLKEIPNKTFQTKADALAYLVDNKASIIANNQAMTKQADSIYYQAEQGTNKAIKSNSDVLTASLVINTTNVMDSHSDVHMKGIWKKSLSEKKNIVLLQEHIMKFDHIISDNVKASTKEIAFSELGFKQLFGTTEALIFDTTIEKERNPFMFTQYQKGYVKEHSVGMQYVKMELAVSPDAYESKEENDIWEKYINEVANKEDAQNNGHFWAILEAKVIEGSAVPKGSNSITPILEITEAEKITSDFIEPEQSTQSELKQFYQTLLKN